ncbi:reverse transcriptase domain-containing protein, partial [Tanacetum coccineum]
YAPRHKCPSQLFSLEVIVGNDNEEIVWEVEREDVDCKLSKALNVVQEEDNVLYISLNALIRRNPFQTMRVTGYVGKHEIHILIDSGSTYNFLDSNTVIMEYLVKISKKARILELKRRNMKITVLTSYTPVLVDNLIRHTAYSDQLNTAYRSFDTCMTRSLTKELLTPFKEPEREFRSSMKLFKTLSLDESRSPEYNLFSDLEENFEKEAAETMAETMEQYMIKTRADYRSGIARPKIDDKDHFELKGQFIKEPRANTFSDSDHEDAKNILRKL